MMKKILLITNENDVTSDFVVKDLQSANTEFYRFNTNRIGKSVQLNLDISRNVFKLYDSILNQCIDLSQIQAIYYRRPEIPSTPEGLTAAEVNFFKSELYYTLEGIYAILQDAYWINNVYSIRGTENKIYQLLVAQKLGFEIPASLITNLPDSAQAFYNTNHDCIIKPIKSGLLIADEKEEGIIFTSKIDITSQNLQRVRSCPVYLQNHIRKKGDVRVTVVGEKVFAAFIHSQELEESMTDWRKANRPLLHSLIDLPNGLRKKCLSLCNEFSLNFAAIDFILDVEDRFVFLEINPNGQWAWIQKQLNYNISNEIAQLLLKNIS